MKFRKGDGVANILHPIIDGVNYYSPLVFSGSNVISPWKADIVVYPTRETSIYQGFGDNFACNWPDYLDSSIYVLQKKTITAYEKNGKGLFYSKSGSTRGVPSYDWAQHYYTGIDPDGNFGGVFWNTHNFSAITTNTTALTLNYNFMFSIRKENFLPRTTGFSYNWNPDTLLPTHIYNTYFPNSTNKFIYHIDVAGELQPQTYACYIGVKAGHNVESNTTGYLRCGGGNYSNYTKECVIESRNINTLVTGATNKKYFNTSTRGMITHFTVDRDSYYDYFHVEGVEPFKEMFGTQYYPSGFSTPVIGIGETSDPITGAYWKNATAHAYFSDGTSASAVGDFHFAPGNDSRTDFLRAVGTPMDFFLEDLSFGVSANV